jgi:hypothetical protein
VPLSNITPNQGSGGGGTGTVTNVSSADTSIVVSTPTTTPVLQMAAANVLFTNSPPLAAVPFNAQKGTGIANGTAATDIAAYGQTPAGGSLVVNAQVNAAAAIAYSKLNLAASVVNADIAVGAAIAYSKLSLTGSVVNADIASGAGIAYSKLTLTGSVVNADVASGAAIAIAKLADPGAGFVIGSSSGAAAVRPPGYEWDYVQITAGVNVTGTTEGASTTVITGNAVTFDGAPVLLEVFCPRIIMDTGAAGDQFFICLFESGASIGRLANFRTASITAQTQYVARVGYRFTPTAGSHTYSIACFISSTTGTPKFDAGAAGVGNMVPAYYRVTKV